VCFVGWANDVFSGSIPLDTAKFGSVCEKVENAGESCFDKAAVYALSCLTMLVSNPLEEQIFSSVT